MNIRKIILLAVIIITPLFSFAEDNYILKEGDKIKINLQEVSDFETEFQIDKEGYVYLPEVGKLKISNLNLRLSSLVHTIPMHLIYMNTRVIL